MKKTVKQITIVIALFLMLCNSVIAQNTSKFVINGVLKNFKTMPKKLFLIYPEYEKKETDSSDVVNGTYKFTGEIENDALPLQIALGPSLDLMGPMLDLQVKANIIKGETKVVSDGMLYNYTETGASEKVYNQYKDIYQKYLKPAIKFTNKRYTVDYRSRQTSRAQAYEEYKGESKDYVVDHYNFIVQHPNSALAPYIAFSISNYLEVKEKADSLIDILSASDIKSKVRTAALKQLREKSKELAAASLVLAGNMAPDFTQNDVDGNPVKLSSFKGKFVLIDFWASWCGPCRAENPNVVKAYTKYKAKNFEILSVSLDNTNAKDAWQAAIKKDGLTWAQVSDLKGWQNEAGKLYAVKAIPQNFLVDPSGKIIATNLRGEELDKALDKFLK